MPIPEALEYRSYPSTAQRIRISAFSYRTASIHSISVAFDVPGVDHHLEHEWPRSNGLEE
jgi:hypothetical protein